MGNVDFKFRQDIFPEFRHKLTLLYNILSQL